MPEAPDTVTVPRDLEALIPAFLANRRGELDALRAALAAGDLVELRRIGHRMKGVGASYGFNRISAFGTQIEDAARSGDRAAAAACLDAYARYLPGLRIVYG